MRVSGSMDSNDNSLYQAMDYAAYSRPSLEVIRQVWSDAVSISSLGPSKAPRFASPGFTHECEHRLDPWMKEWRNAIEKCSESRKREYINTRGHSAKDPLDLHREFEATVAKELRKGGDAKWTTRFDQFVRAVNNHACVGDVFVQSQGPAVTIVWSSVRLCFLIAVADIFARKEVTDHLFDIANHLSSTEERLGWFPRKERLVRAAKDLFSSALLYLVDAIFLLRKSKVLRALQATSGKFLDLRAMYQQVLTASAQIDRELTNAQEECSRKDAVIQVVIDRLTPTKNNEFRPCLSVQGTGQWLLSHDCYLQWITQRRSQLLWLQGVNGCGKSTLAHLLSQMFSGNLVFLYSGLEYSETSTFCDAILTWIFSLAKQFPDPMHPLSLSTAVADSVRTIHERLQHNSTISFSLKMKALQNILSSPDLPEMVLIVDSSNELGKEYPIPPELYPVLLSAPKLRVIVLSRASPPSMQSVLSFSVIHMDARTTSIDVQNYAAQRIESHHLLRPIKAQILHFLKRAQPRTFLSMEILLNDLESADTVDHQMEKLKTATIDAVKTLEKVWEDNFSKLDLFQQRTCQDMFKIIVAARRILYTWEVVAFLAFDIEENRYRGERVLLDPEKKLEKFGLSFISIEREKVHVLESIHRDVVLQKTLNFGVPNETMAERCLSVLMEQRYSSVTYAIALVRKHVLDQTAAASTAMCNISDDSLPYEYAALNWQIHIIAIQHPSTAILKKLNAFITSIAAVTWSERLVDIRARKETSSINVQIDIRAELTVWAETLPSDSRKQIALDQFFITCHRNLRERLMENDQDDHLLPYLPAIRLGQFFSIAGTSDFDFQQAYAYKEMVVKGFTDVLGRRNPLTLRARTDFINEFFSQGLILEAEEELLDLVDIEKEVLGLESVTYYCAIRLLGNAQYYSVKFDQASAAYKEANEGLLRLLSEEDWNYQVNNLYHGWVYERQGNFDEAERLYRMIIDVWVPARSKTNGLSIFAYTSLASLLRKKQDYQVAKSNLEFSWQTRLNLFSIDSNTTVDSGLQLALLYRDMDLGENALQILSRLQKSKVLEQDFERACQTTYIRALVEFDQGQLGNPIRALMQIVDETVGERRQYNNRECLWVRIMLADALRRIGREGEALMLFSELIRPSGSGENLGSSTPSLEDEPEPPAQLGTAEEALRLVKNRDMTGAERLLRNKGFEWVRPEDFFLRQGGPSADTAWIVPVRFQEHHVGQYKDMSRLPGSYFPGQMSFFED